MVIKITFKNEDVKNYRESVVKYDIGFITIYWKKWKGNRCRVNQNTEG